VPTGCVAAKAVRFFGNIVKIGKIGKKLPFGTIINRNLLSGSK